MTNKYLKIKAKKVIEIMKKLLDKKGKRKESRQVNKTFTLKRGTSTTMPDVFFVRVREEKEELFILIAYKGEWGHVKGVPEIADEIWSTSENYIYEVLHNYYK